jgi:hypothetical protein
MSSKLTSTSNCPPCASSYAFQKVERQAACVQPNPYAGGQVCFSFNPCPTPCPPTPTPAPCPTPCPPTPAPLPNPDTCGCAYPVTVASIKNPATKFEIPLEDFSDLSSLSRSTATNSNQSTKALKANVTVDGENVQTTLVKWQTDNVPDLIGSFDKTTGVFTVAAAGEYSLRLVVNYINTFYVQVPTDDLEELPIPYFEIYDVPSGNGLVASVFGINSTIATPPSSTSPGTSESYLNLAGQVIIDTQLPFQAGAQFAVRACTNGLTYTPPDGGDKPATILLTAPYADTTLTVSKNRNLVTTTMSLN